MKLSRLIAELTEARLRVGDVEVVLLDLDWYDCRVSDYPWPKVDTVEVWGFDATPTVAICAPYDNTGLRRFPVTPL